MQSFYKSSTVLSLAILAACLAAAYFLLRPQWDQFSLLRTQLQQQRQTSTQLHETLLSIDSFLSDYDARQKDAQTVNSALPAKTSDLSGFVSSLGELAKSSGVVLASLQLSEAAPDKAAANNSIQSKNIVLTAAGSYASFKDFVLRLENHLRLIDIQHLTLKADEMGSIQYQINLKTYYQK